LAFECTVDNVGTVVVHVRHDGLVHGTIPSNIARSSESVSVDVLVSHVEHWVLASSPLSVCIRNWGVLWQNTGDVPVEKVWVVCECFGVQSVVVHEDWAIVFKTTAKTLDNEHCNPAVSKENTSIEILDRKFTDNEETKHAADLSSACVVSPVEIRSIDWSCNFLHLAAREPASQDGKLTLSLRGPCWHDFLKVMFGQTKANQFVVLNVF
jgi:hypothetical protein